MQVQSVVILCSIQKYVSIVKSIGKYNLIAKSYYCKT